MDFEKIIKESINQLNEYTQGNDSNVEVVIYEKDKRVTEKRNTWCVDEDLNVLNNNMEGFIELVAEFEEQYQSYEEASKMDKEYYKENMENIIKAMQLAYPKETDKYVEGKLDPKNYQ